MSTDERIVGGPAAVERFVGCGYSAGAADTLRTSVVEATKAMHADGRYGDARPGRLELVLRVTRED